MPTSRLLWFFFLGLFIVAATSAQDLNTEAPDFTGQSLAEESVQLSSYRGKIVLLDFWASWCGPCRIEMPFLAQLKQENQDEAFEIIAVNIDTEVESALAFLDELETEISFVILSDPETKIPPLYDLQAMPTSLFIDANGIVRYKHDGFKEREADQFRAELKTLLDELKSSPKP